MTSNALTADAQEGMGAFLEKRARLNGPVREARCGAGPLGTFREPHRARVPGGCDEGNQVLPPRRPPSWQYPRR